MENKEKLLENEKPKQAEQPKQKAAVKPFSIKHEGLAGETIHAKTNKPIAFNDKGIANPCEEDFDYLLLVHGYEKV